VAEDGGVFWPWCPCSWLSFHGSWSRNFAAAAESHLDLEEHLVIDRRDALLRCLVVGKALGSLGQQRMSDLIERRVGARKGQHEVLAQAPQGGPRPPWHG
jgi:hypothetical protein